MIGREHSLMLLHLFNRVPTQTAPMWDWHSREGDLFLTLVEELVEVHGVDINEVGSLVGIRNFSQRYRILNRGRGGSRTSTSVDGHQDQEPRGRPVGPDVPEVWGPVDVEGSAG